MSIIGRQSRLRVRLVTTTMLLGAALAPLGGLPQALAVSGDVVISQVYGGGGSASATYANDFVELHNLSGNDVDVTGWTVQYASATGTSYGATPLSGVISPGGYYLVKEQGGPVGATLPPADATGTLALAATAGKVALVRNTTTCSSNTCSGGLSTVDFVGYGASATDSESSPAPAPAASTGSVTRKLGGDTDNNATDFVAGDANPRDSATAPDGVYATTTTIASSADPVVTGTELVLTATVRSEGGTPGGSVTFYDGAFRLGTVRLDGGSASLRTSNLMPGTHTQVQARYEPAGPYLTSADVRTQHVEFTDVPTFTTFGPDIYWLVDHRFATGFPDGSFRPSASLTRQAFAAYLHRYAHAGEDAGPCSGASPYSDVPASSPFCGDIAWLASQGITTGYPDGSFRPGASVTRQATAAFLYRYNHGGQDGGACSPGTSAFADVPDNSAFCRDIAWLYDHAIAYGFADGTFRPGATASRQAMAAYLHRYNTNV